MNNQPEAEISLRDTIRQVVAIVVRNRWWVLVSMCVATLATFLYLRYAPNEYKSEATLLVVQQAIPERYVTPTSTTDITEALQAAAEEVLSRTQMLAIADEFGLFAKERKRLSAEEILLRMRLNIDIKPIESGARRDVNSFKISFIASDPYLAQQVTSKLTSLFVEQNLETREHQATTTTNFLQDQLESVRQKLADAEEQVREFKMSNLGELPEQAQGNIMILSGLQTQLQSTMSGLNRAQEQRQYLESLAESRILALQSDLTRLNAEKTKLLERYTAQYPAILKLNEKIAQTDALIKMMNEPSPGNGKASAPNAALVEDVALAQLKGQLESNRLEIEHLNESEKKLTDDIAQYQRRLNQAPVREQQLVGIQRNYEFLKQQYGDLLTKEMQSQEARDLEKRQVGQQFRLLDRASYPRLPFKPDRLKTSLGGVAAGLGIGLALAFLWNSRDQSIHPEEELISAFGLPFVVGVPVLLTPVEERRRDRKKTIDRMAMFAVCLAVFAVELYQFHIFR